MTLSIATAASGVAEAQTPACQVSAPAARYALTLNDFGLAGSAYVDRWDAFGNDNPMEEVFVSFRRCNASGHFLITTMPYLDPPNLALRYARLIDERIRA